MAYPDTWYYWTTTASSTSDTTWDGWNWNYTTDQVWDNWATTTATSTVLPIWEYWVTAAGTASVTYTPYVYAPYVAPQPTPEELEARRVERERIVARRLELQREKDEAVAKAEQLLKENLEPAQVESYDLMKEFLVKAQSGKTYRIKKGWGNNVDLLDDEGQPVMRFCIHPTINCPEQDNMLAQKLMLEHDEERFVKAAHRQHLRELVA